MEGIKIPNKYYYARQVIAFVAQIHETVIKRERPLALNVYVSWISPYFAGQFG
jgi:hypothetical protein